MTFRRLVDREACKANYLSIDLSRRRGNGKATNISRVLQGGQPMAPIEAIENFNYACKRDSEARRPWASISIRC